MQKVLAFALAMSAFPLGGEMNDALLLPYGQVGLHLESGLSDILFDDCYADNVADTNSLLKVDTVQY